MPDAGVNGPDALTMRLDANPAPEYASRGTFPKDQGGTNIGE